MVDDMVQKQVAQARGYFARNGYIYGVAEYVQKFKNFECAEMWLNFKVGVRNAELCSKSRAIAIAGKRAVDNARIVE